MAVSIGYMTVYCDHRRSLLCEQLFAIVPWGEHNYIVVSFLFQAAGTYVARLRTTEWVRVIPRNTWRSDTYVPIARKSSRRRVCYRGIYSSVAKWIHVSPRSPVPTALTRAGTRRTWRGTWKMFTAPVTITSSAASSAVSAAITLTAFAGTRGPSTWTNLRNKLPPFLDFRSFLTNF